MDKLNQLSLGEKLIVGGGILMLLAAFFQWYRLDIGGFSGGTNGFEAPGSIWSILAILISLVLAGLTLAMRLGNMAAPNLPEGLTWGKVWGAGAALVVLLILLKAWRIMDVPAGGFGLGFFIALIATIAIAVGGYMMYSEEKSAYLNRP